EQIVVAVERCPTGALTYTRRDGAAAEIIPDVVEIRIGRDGPLTVHGAGRVVGERVGPLDDARTATGRFALCRCGQTGHAPYCDNSHRALTPGWGSDDRGVTPALAPPAAPLPERAG
ncbi:MAG TPA: CDGSH iron-sulfur domain-containing protein, partial [Gemmatirosa sp.]